MAEKNSDNGYYPKAGDELRFYLKHLINLVKKEKPVEDDKLFKATNVKTYDRKKDRHGYNPGENQKVYESEDRKQKLSKMLDKTVKKANFDWGQDKSRDQKKASQYKSSQAAFLYAAAHDKIGSEDRKNLIKQASKSGERARHFSKKLNEILKVESLGEALSYDFKKLKKSDSAIPPGRTSDEKFHAASPDRDKYREKRETAKQTKKLHPDNLIKNSKDDTPRKPPKVYAKESLDEARGSTVDNDAAVELKLHADNSSHLFHGHRQMVHNNQMRHAKAGRYNRELAVKAWEHHARVAADDYASTYGGLGERGHNIFNKATRKAVAKQLEKEHYEDHIGPYLANQRGFNK